MLIMQNKQPSFSKEVFNVYYVTTMCYFFQCCYNVLWRVNNKNNFDKVVRSIKLFIATNMFKT